MERNDDWGDFSLRLPLIMKIQAVMVIVLYNGRFLLGKRSLWKTSAPGYWCPVSGKIEAGESEKAAVIRETWEEVGLKVLPVRKLAELQTRDGSTILHTWLVKVLEGEAFLKNNEHSELGWFSLEEIRLLDPVFHEDLAILESLT